MWKKCKQFLLQFRHTYHTPIVFSPIELLVGDEPFLVRQIEPDDISQLLRVERLCYQGETPWTEAVFLREISRKNHTLYLAIEKEHEIIGFCGGWFVKDEAHISNLAVVPTFQHRGLASRLIVWQAAVARAKHCKKLTLEVRKSNINAQKLYEKLHFQLTGLKKDYYCDHGELEDAVLMSLSLTGQEVQHEL